MDEAAFRQARDELNPRPCHFEKAVLARCCACSEAQRRHIAEREAVACRDAAARASCLGLRELMHRNAAFALRQLHADEPLPHALEMKMQCGGLSGLQQAIAPGAEVEDVAALVRAALASYGALENLPWPRIVQGMAAFHLRRRRS